VTGAGWVSIAGAADRPTPGRHADAGHLAMVAQPHVVADAILEFITEHRGTDVLARPYDGFAELLGARDRTCLWSMSQQ
jgi:hypothetical protein